MINRLASRSAILRVRVLKVEHLRERRNQTSPLFDFLSKERQPVRNFSTTNRKPGLAVAIHFIDTLPHEQRNDAFSFRYGSAL